MALLLLLLLLLFGLALLSSTITFYNLLVLLALFALLTDSTGNSLDDVIGTGDSSFGSTLSSKRDGTMSKDICVS